MYATIAKEVGKLAVSGLARSAGVLAALAAAAVIAGVVSSNDTEAAKVSPKGDLSRIDMAHRTAGCDGANWPNIPSHCVTVSDAGSSVGKTVRYISVTQNAEGGTTVVGKSR